MEYFINMVAAMLKMFDYDVRSLTEHGKLRDQIRLGMHDVHPEFGNHLRRLMMDQANELGIHYSDALVFVDGFISALHNGYGAANDYIRSSESIMAMAMRLDAFGAMASIQPNQSVDIGEVAATLLSPNASENVSVESEVPGTKATLGITDLQDHLHLPTGHWVFEGVKDNIDLLGEIGNKAAGTDVVISGLISLMVKSTAAGKFDLVAQLADQIAGLVNVLGKKLIEKHEKANELSPEWVETLKTMTADDGVEATGPKAAVKVMAHRISEMSAVKSNMIPPLSTLLWTLAAEEAKEKPPLESKPAPETYRVLPNDWKVALEALGKFKNQTDVNGFEPEVVKLAKAISRCNDVKNGYLPTLTSVIAVIVKPGNYSDAHLRKVEKVIDHMISVHAPKEAAAPAK